MVATGRPLQLSEGRTFSAFWIWGLEVGGWRGSRADLFEILCGYPTADLWRGVQMFTADLYPSTVFLGNVVEEIQDSR